MHISLKIYIITQIIHIADSNSLPYTNLCTVCDISNEVYEGEFEIGHNYPRESAIYIIQNATNVTQGEYVYTNDYNLFLGFIHYAIPLGISDNCVSTLYTSVFTNNKYK